LLDRSVFSFSQIKNYASVLHRLIEKINVDEEISVWRYGLKSWLFSFRVPETVFVTW